MLRFVSIASSYDYVPDSSDGFYLILFQHTNTILENSILSTPSKYIRSLPFLINGTHRIYRISLSERSRPVFPMKNRLQYVRLAVAGITREMIDAAINIFSWNSLCAFSPHAFCFANSRDRAQFHLSGDQTLCPYSKSST